MWEEKYNRDIIITTGDGVVFNCIWNYASKTLEFNNTIYDFINKKKSFVDRRNPKSRVFNLSFYFQGENNIEIAEKFEKSSEDKRYWIVNHPLYGILYGHPVSIGFSNEYLNTTSINVEFIETITDEAGITAIDNDVNSQQQNYNELSDFSAQSFSRTEITSDVKKSFIQNMSDVYSKYRSIYHNENIQDFQIKVKNISNAIDGVISYPYNFVKDLYGFIGYIASVRANISTKISTCIQIYEDLKALPRVKQSEKKYFETLGSSVLGTMALSLLNSEDTSLLTRKQLSEINNTVSSVYADYFNELEVSEIELEDFNNGFAMDFNTQNSLYSLLISSVYQLMNLMYNAQQERIVSLNQDSNIILLTHRYYGLDENDENIEIFRNINNFRNDKVFIIKKGTQIKYYI